jgi:hypothetical protein
MGPKNVDAFRECFIKTSDGREIPLRVEEINFDPMYIGPEITGYLLSGWKDSKSNDPIEKVIFNDPATIVIWKDKTKTVVKCQAGDTYSPELGLAMCFAKKYLGNKGNFNEVFKKWIPEEKSEPELIVPVDQMRQKLQEFCSNHGLCSRCPLDTRRTTCGKGFTFVDEDPDTIVSDEEVKESYEIVFGNKED